MELLLFLILLGLIGYGIHLNSRIDKLEQKALQTQIAKTPTSLKAVTSGIPSIPVQSKSVSVTAPKAVPAEQFEGHSFINLLPKIGVVALVIGLGFFLKYAIDQGWISIYVRLIIGGTIGTLLLILFYIWRDKYPKYALALAGGGLSILYLTVWASVELYSLLSTNSGLVFMTIVTLIGLSLAYYTRSKVLAALAWGGAYIVPFILGIGLDQYTLLLTYLTIVSTAQLVTIIYNKALYLFLLALFGVLLNVLWATIDHGIPNEQYLTTMIFLLVNLFIFSLTFAFSIRGREGNQTPTDQNEYSLISVLILGSLSIPIAVIAYNHFWDYAPIIVAVLAVWMFLIYALVDRIEYKAVNHIISGLGAAMFTLAILWQFGDTSQIIMLYILGLVGITIGRMQNRAEIRSWSLVVTLIGICTASIFSYGYDVPAFLISTKFGLEALGLVVLLCSYFILNKEQLTSFEGRIHIAIQYIIAVLTWLFVSWDLAHYFSSYNEINQRNIFLSLWWLTLGITLMAMSSKESLKPLRKLGLFLIGLVVIKVFLYDVQSLDTVYRIISFIGLGGILLGFSFVYQHNKEKIKEYLQ